MDSKKKIKTLVKDTGLFAISNFGSKILVFLLTPLYTSILTTEEYGIADLITTTISFIYPILTLAIADATLRYALDKGNDKRKVLNNSILLTLLSIAVLLLFKPAIMLVSQTIGHYWTIFVITYALFNIHNCISNYIVSCPKILQQENRTSNNFNPQCNRKIEQLCSRNDWQFIFLL